MAWNKLSSLKKYCAICNERGHAACMSEMKASIRLHSEQENGAKKFSLIPRLCVLCDKYHGLFPEVNEECHDLVRHLSQQVGKDDANVVKATVKTAFAQPLDDDSSSSDEKEATPARWRTHIGGDGEAESSAAGPSRPQEKHGKMRGGKGGAGSQRRGQRGR